MALIGIDIGTSAVKVAAFDEDGIALAWAEEPLTLNTPHPGWAEQNPSDWYAAACKALRSVADKLNESIDGVSIAGQSWAMVLLDESGEVLCPTPIWMDQRAAEICQSMPIAVAEDLFALSGNPFAPGYTTPKLLWMKENYPHLLQRARWVLQSNSYIAYRLTGAVWQDPSQGYGLHCYDMRNGAWDISAAKALGIDPAILPPIAECASIAGTVSQSASLDTGLPVGTPVTLGGLDAACAALGAGVYLPGQAQEQGGQAGGMGIALDERGYTQDRRLILSAHVLPGLWLLQGGTVGGGGALRWMHAQLGASADAEAQKRRVSPYQVLCEWAQDVPPGSEGLVFLPYLSGERSPIWDPYAKGVYYGLDYAKTLPHIARATLEGVAFSLLHNLDIAEQAGADAKTLFAMGGSAQSAIWTQIKADICQREFIVPDAPFATTLGAAMLCALALGIYKDAAQAVSRTVRVTRQHTPNEQNTNAYDEAYSLYRALYPALQGIMRRNAP